MTPRPIALSLLAASIALPLLASALRAGELDIPARKPGLWDIKMTPRTAGATPVISMQTCLDASSDRQMMQNGLAMTQGTCSDINQSRDGDAIAIDSTCNINGGVAHTHLRITGDFQSSYRLEIVSEREGGNAKLPKHSEMTQEATWKGPCTGGMEPGDVMLLGHKINILNAITKPGG